MNLNFNWLWLLPTGPTCDSTDVLCRGVELELLQIDDIIYFTKMGAYTITINTPFNGFGLTKILYFKSSDEVNGLAAKWPPTLHPQSFNWSQTFILNWLQDFPFLSFPFINFSFIFALHGELSKLEESSIKNNKRKIEIKNFAFAMKICENISSSFRKTKENFDSKVNKNNSETRSFQNVAKKLNRSKENKIVDETSP